LKRIHKLDSLLNGKAAIATKKKTKVQLKSRAEKEHELQQQEEKEHEERIAAIAKKHFFLRRMADQISREISEPI
jgi:dynactin complex subunit